MRVKTKLIFSPENLYRACVRRFGFCVVAYDPQKGDSCDYRKGKVVLEIWGTMSEHNYISLGAAKRSDWKALINLIDKKWPGILPTQYPSRIPDSTARFFKVVRRKYGPRENK